MNEDLEHLEREVERQLAELAAMLSVEPPPGTVERVQEATSRALNEAWLASQPAPTPDAATLARVQSAVRHELVRTVGDHSPFSWRIWRLTWPAVAAAAVVVIGVGVIRYVSSSRPAVTPVDTASADQTVDLFVQAANRVWTEDSLIASLRMDIDSIEESIFKRSRTTSDGVEEILEDIESRIDELFIEPNASERTSGVYRVQPGAIG